MTHKDNIRRVLPYLSKEQRETVEKLLNQKSEDEIKNIVTSKYPCKKCGKLLSTSEILEHAVLEHGDKDSGKVLDELNKFRGT